MKQIRKIFSYRMHVLTAVIVSFVVGGMILFALLLITCRFPISVESKEDMETIALCRPVVLVVQDQSWLDPESFPYTTFLLSPWEFPFYFTTRFYVVRALLSSVIFLQLLDRVIGYVQE